MNQLNNANVASNSNCFPSQTRYIKDNDNVFRKRTHVLYVNYGINQLSPTLHNLDFLVPEGNNTNGEDLVNMKVEGVTDLEVSDKWAFVAVSYDYISKQIVLFYNPFLSNR